MMYVVTHKDVSWLVHADTSYLARRAVRQFAQVPLGELKARTATSRDKQRFDDEYRVAVARRRTRDRIVNGSDRGELVRDRDQ